MLRSIHGGSPPAAPENYVVLRSGGIEVPLVVAITDERAEFFRFLPLDREENIEKTSPERIAHESRGGRRSERSVPLRGQRAGGRLRVRIASDGRTGIDALF